MEIVLIVGSVVTVFVTKTGLGGASEIEHSKVGRH